MIPALKMSCLEPVSGDCCCIYPEPHFAGNTLTLLIRNHRVSFTGQADLKEPDRQVTHGFCLVTGTQYSFVQRVVVEIQVPSLNEQQLFVVACLTAYACKRTMPFLNTQTSAIHFTSPTGKYRICNLFQDIRLQELRPHFCDPRQAPKKRFPERHVRYAIERIHEETS